MNTDRMVMIAAVLVCLMGIAMLVVAFVFDKQPVSTMTTSPATDRPSTTKPPPAAWYTPLAVVARPPSLPLTRSDSVLARLINAIDADMRSIELGKWFLAAMRAQVPVGTTLGCDDIVDMFAYERIAAAVPGINDVTKRETVKTLRALASMLSVEACDMAYKSTVTSDDLLAVLDKYEKSAFDDRQGVLLGMPGYSTASRLALPPPGSLA